MANASAFIIICAAVAGYIFSTKCYRFKYRVARESGYKLYLTSLTFGLLFMLIAGTISEALFILPKFLDFKPIFILSDFQETVVICITANFLSLLTALGYNRWTPDARELNAYKVWKKNDYDFICFRAMADEKPIAISHDSGKVYVGYVIDTMVPAEENAHLTILPIYSGYRAPETLQFTLVTRYQHVIELIASNKSQDEKAAELEDYYMALPRTKICSLHIFNDHLHRSVSQQYATQSTTTKEAQEAIEKAQSDA